MSIMETFPKRITELRKSLKMTQREFAKELNITAASVSSYENGAKFPSIVTVYDIAQRFGVSIDWLCGNEVTRHETDYATAFRLFVDLMECDGFSGETLSVAWDAFMPDSSTININADSTMLRHIDELSKMYNLYRAGTIDKKLYGLWVDNKIKEIQADIFIDDNEGFFVPAPPDEDLPF